MGTIGLEDLSDVDTLKNEVLSLKEEVTSSKKDVKELTQKLENHRTVVTTLAQANEILGNRFRRLERSVEAGRSAQDDLGTAFGEHRGDYRGVIAALEEGYNRMDGRLRGLMVDQKEVITAQGEALATQITRSRHF
jgi:predicted  nucleic acid-binding Zn-ribbon protein